MKQLIKQYNKFELFFIIPAIMIIFMVASIWNFSVTDGVSVKEFNMNVVDSNFRHTAMPNILLLLGMICAGAAASLRIIKHRANIPFALGANGLIGAGLLVLGANTDGLLNILFYGTVSVLSIPRWYDDPRVKKILWKPNWFDKLLSKMTWLNKLKINKGIILSAIIFVLVFVIITFLYKPLGNYFIDDYGFKTIGFWLDVLAAAILITACLSMEFLKSKWSFVIFTIANTLLMFVFSPLICNQEWARLDMFVMMGVYSLINVYLYYKWR